MAFSHLHISLPHLNRVFGGTYRITAVWFSWSVVGAAWRQTVEHVNFTSNAANSGDCDPVPFACMWNLDNFISLNVECQCSSQRHTLKPLEMWKLLAQEIVGSGVAD